MVWSASVESTTICFLGVDCILMLCYSELKNFCLCVCLYIYIYMCVGVCVCVCVCVLVCVCKYLPSVRGVDLPKILRHHDVWGDPLRIGTYNSSACERY